MEKLIYSLAILSGNPSYKIDTLDIQILTIALVFITLHDFSALSATSMSENGSS